MNDFDINDIRMVNDFKGMTFSKFKKTEAKKELLNSLKNGKIEDSLNWSSEFVCCGSFIDLWDSILLFVGKHIHLANPKLPIYLLLRFNNFKDILQNGYVGFELNMRNNPKIRKLFAEIITVLCLSKKKHSIENISIKKKEEFDMDTMSSKLKAPSIDYVSKIFKSEDPKVLTIAINELMYHLSNDSLNSLESCYWVEWILEFENLCKKKKECIICERRSFVSVEEKYQKEPIWIIWDCFFYYSTNKNCSIISKIIKSLFELFCIKYTSGEKKKRKYLLYFVISLLTESVNKNIKIIENDAKVKSVTDKINLIYKQIKKNEESPNTDYLFNGVEKSNREKTIEKLETMKSLNTFIRKEN